MRRAIPTLAALIAVGACLKHAFSRASDDVADEFGNDDNFVPAGFASSFPADAGGSQQSGTPSVTAHGAGGNPSPQEV